MKKILLIITIASAFLFTGCFKAGCDGVELFLEQTEEEMQTVESNPKDCDEYIRLADGQLSKIKGYLDGRQNGGYGVAAMSYMERYNICKEELRLKMIAAEKTVPDIMLQATLGYPAKKYMEELAKLRKREEQGNLANGNLMLQPDPVFLDSVNKYIKELEKFSQVKNNN